MTTNAADAQLTALRHALIEGLQRQGTITDARIAEAFATVPRHLFLPQVAPEQVYSNQAIITKTAGGVNISSSSQPAMMAIMLGQLLVEPRQRILEIGAGTGYNAALLRFLVGPSGSVTTIDVDDDIVEAARAQIAAAGYHDVRVILGDGGYGYPADAPYDRIILTVGASDLLPAWHEQLRPEGILVLPISLGPGMYSLALRKLPNGTLISESLSPCGFIRLRGVFASAERELAFGPWQVACEPGPRLDLAHLPELLAQATTTITLPAETTEAQLFLAFTGVPLARLLRRDTAGQPDLYSERHALLDTVTMSGCTVPGWQGAAITQIGPPSAYERLRAQLETWAALGKPRLSDVRVLVLPQGSGIAPPPAALTIERPHATFVLTGRDGRPLSAR
jgi:protein-L-isoaspartate(D-aspartate) O-methyltransferase